MYFFGYYIRLKKKVNNDFRSKSNWDCFDFIRKYEYDLVKLLL